MKNKLDYKKAGVDIDAGEKAVELIKPLAKSTFTKNVVADIGSFGAMYKLDLHRWSHPILVSSTDSVGTKVHIANMMNKWDTVGQDIVNHCVNDILTQGAFPLFFLDYIGIGKVVPEHVQEIVRGISIACKENECTLIGGELAEMPSLYKVGDFDLVGTIVGCVEEDNVISGSEIYAGDILLGFSSTGLHTNGYTLARKIVFELMELNPDSYIDELQDTIGEVLLTVHRSYYMELKSFILQRKLKGIAHITGGGIKGNLKRIIPDGLTAVIDTTAWDIPPLFSLLQKGGNVETDEMFRAFNMGIGLIVVVDQAHVQDVLDDSDAFVIGSIKNGEEKVQLI
ncbi:MAG TPA: phosphoribosylformylglycinamidine cyclo-ligase [Candidatus Cloacimonetes bacterium]|nr:phosphoribosylformylglycinamidine cyclo-ligase [Candidatus Cloacimonadota bacterium]HEX38138.1 phosphoribosylformylglycinamidine cyclo-ligase [Candidatus Cloacimonadota bacterium]